MVPEIESSFTTASKNDLTLTVFLRLNLFIVSWCEYLFQIDGLAWWRVFILQSKS